MVIGVVYHLPRKHFCSVVIDEDCVVVMDCVVVVDYVMKKGVDAYHLMMVVGDVVAYHLLLVGTHHLLMVVGDAVVCHCFVGDVVVCHCFVGDVVACHWVDGR